MTTRRLIQVAAAIVAIVGIAVVVAFDSSFQTWAVQRTLARQPELGLKIGHVSAGLSRIELRDVVYQSGGWKFAAPVLTAELGVISALLRDTYEIKKLEAKGWQLSRAAAAGSPAAADQQPTEQAAQSTAAGPASGATPVAQDSIAPAARSPVVKGLFSRLEMPVDLSVAELDLSGTVRSGSTVAMATIKGGGLRAGSDGNIAVSVDAALKESAVGSVLLKGDVRVRMATPRTFEHLRATFDGMASGGALAETVSRRLVVDARSGAGVENYRLSVTQPDRSVVSIDAAFTPGEQQVTGKWEADVRDEDLSPFLLGSAVPTFAMKGRGTVDTDAAFTRVRVIGTADGTADRLSVLNEALVGIGKVQVTADVDVARERGVLSVSKVDIAVASVGAGDSNHPVGTIQALQPFNFDPATAELRATDAKTDLFAITLKGMPLAWAKPAFPELVISGGDISGEVLATPRSGGVSLRSKVPLSVSRLAVGTTGEPLVRELDVSLNIAADYTPAGWQAEVNGQSARSGGGTVLMITAKAGQLSARGSPLMATGLLTVDLAALAGQPALKGILSVSAGEAVVDFAASLAERKQLQATVSLKNLVSGTAARKPLPAVTASLRADLDANGRITVNAPMTLDREGRTSDLTVAGWVEPAAKSVRFEAQVSSNLLQVEDAKALALLTAPRPPQADTQPESNAWAGWNGTLGVQFKRVVAPAVFEMTNVRGVLRIADGAVNFEDVRAALGGQGDARVSGALRFEPRQQLPYIAGFGFSLHEFEPASLLGSSGGQLVPIDGRFSVSGRLSGRAARIEELRAALLGEVEITSKSGNFRGLPVNVGNLVENSGKLAAWLAAAGDAITAPFVGRRDFDEITSRSQAANELAKLLSDIAYDQLNIVATEEEHGIMRVKQFTLISPELRITGSGVARRPPGAPMLGQAVELNLVVRARGRPAELMKYLGVLDSATDDLGYAGCTIPIRVEGALDRLDTTQLSNRLVALAVEKTGLTEKAVDWINRLRGKGTN